MCRYVVGLVFGCEHLLLILALWLRYAIHSTTKPVRLAIARRNYLSQQRLEEQGRDVGGGGVAAEREEDKRKKD